MDQDQPQVMPSGVYSGGRTSPSELTFGSLSHSFKFMSRSIHHALFPILLSLLLLAGCRIMGSESRMLLHGQPSAEALASQVLQALAGKNKEHLRNLAVTKEEFRTRLWPELPASSIPNLTCDWVWDTFQPSSVAGFAQILAAHGGKRYDFVRVRYAKGTTSYASLKVHEDARVIVRDDGGQEKELKLFGSILEMDGQFKLCSFIVD